MAARENQGYLIAVIILVLLSLVLALVSFLGVQKAYERADEAKATDSKLKVSLLIAKAENLKGEALKAMIGGMGTAPAELEKGLNDIQNIRLDSALADGDKKQIDDIIAEVRTAQEIYQNETNGQIRNEDDAAVATLLSRITDLTSLVDDKVQRNKTQIRQTLEDAREAKAKITQAQEAQALAEKVQEKLTKDLSKEKADALIKQTKLKEQVDEGKKAITKLTITKEEEVSAVKAELAAAENQVALLKVDNVNLKRRLDQLTERVYDYADGQIVRVAPALNVVFIDIGSADGLANNSTFSVYDESVTNFESATAKGSIEVVRVGAFSSEARITNENPVNPILKFDHILTPTWDPGFKLKVALAGRFDLDGDRFDDTNKLVRMIERNGGQVVAKHDDEGNVTGKISPDVRYLVKGNKELIGGQDDDPNAGQILSAQREMEADADKNTVQVIGLQKLLNRLGVRAQSKTTQLDFPPGGFKSDDEFVPRQPGSIRDSGSSTR